MYQIQMRSANECERDDSSKSNRWETVVRESTLEDTLYYLVQGLNEESIVVKNAWLRIVNPDGKIINC